MVSGRVLHKGAGAAEPPARARRIAMFALSTVVGLMLLFSYRTSRGPSPVSPVAVPADTNVGVVSAAPGSTSVSGGASPSASAGSATSSGTASGSTTVNGSVAQTRWGAVQVQVVIANNKITDVKALQYPRGNSRDVQINAYALPQLRSRVLAAQSANIDAVSGATVTSDGYITSLQSALDIAHFK